VVVREIGLGGGVIRLGMTFGPASNLGILSERPRYPVLLSEECGKTFFGRMTRLRVNRLYLPFENADTEMGDD